MTPLERALAFTLRPDVEGAYSNHPADKGGETMMGITVAVARANGYIGPMKDIPVWLVHKIYEKNYWKPAKCDLMTENLSIVMFDSAVNHGVSGAAKLLQKTFDLVEDGIIGPKTLGCTMIADNDDVNKYLDVREERFKEIVKNDPTQGVFLNGWLRRVNNLRKYVLGE